MSNLPPGTSASDIDRHYGGSDHDHRFEEHDSEYFEDGAFMTVTSCGHAPVTSTATSEKHDETFYGHGPRCEATQRVRMDVSEVEIQLANKDWKTLAESDDNVFHDAYGDDDAALDDEFIEEVQAVIAEEIVDEETLAEVDYQTDRSAVSIDGALRERIVTVDFGKIDLDELNGVYRVTYDNVKTSVDQ